MFNSSILQIKQYNKVENSYKAKYKSGQFVNKDKYPNTLIVIYLTYLKNPQPK